MQKRALLIGINEYDVLGELHYARADAEEVAYALKTEYGFTDSEIVLMTDSSVGALTPSRNFIELQLANLRDIRDLELLVVGFWGHGFSQTATIGTDRYLCGRDAVKKELPRTAISLSSMISIIRQIQAVNTCLILDCCRNSAGRGDAANVAMTEGELNALSRDVLCGTDLPRSSQPSTMAILNSCSVGQLAYEWEARKHGIFTAHLLDAMRQRMTSVSNIASYITGKVLATAKSAVFEEQTPYFEIHGGGDIQLPTVSPRANNSVRFIVPNNPKDIDIISCPVSEIQVALPQYSAVTALRPEFGTVTLPPVPEEILRLQTNNRGIDEAVTLLKSKTHPALQSNLEACSVAKNRYEEIERRRDKEWSVLPEDVWEPLKNATKENAKGSVTQFSSHLPEGMSFDDFVPIVLWGQKVEQARLEYERFEKNFTTQLENEIAKLKQQKEKNESELKRAKENFLNRVIEEYLKGLPGYNDPSCPIPNEAIHPFVKSLQDYKLGWESLEIWKQIESYWKESRPCVLEQEKKNRRKEWFISHQDELVAGFCIAAVIILFILAGIGVFCLDASNQRKAEREEAARRVEKEEADRAQAAAAAEAAARAKREEAARLAKEAAVPAPVPTGVEISRPGSTVGEHLSVSINGIKCTCCWCPPGTFMMGSPKTEKDRDDDETQHEVTLSRGFWMLETPVTQEMWKSVMGNNPSFFKEPKLPVEQVSWDNCQNFIAKLNTNSEGMKFRLPSEAEWEYACRAGTSRPYSFGGVLNGEKANCNGNYPYGTSTKGKYLKHTSEVKSYSPNAWGLYDMHGNVSEWCNDWYGDYPGDSVTDPTGPSSGSYRVYRGGGWGNDAGGCRSADRGGNVPGYRVFNLGFRLALVPNK